MYLPSYQTIRVKYNTKLSFSCQSSGIPRPHVDWLVNEQPVSWKDGIWKAPFVSNITIDVKHTMELKCTSQNRGGLALIKIRIVMEGKISFLYCDVIIKTL